MAEDKLYLTEVELLELKLQAEIVKGYEREEDLSNTKIHLIDAQRVIILYKIEEDKKKLNSIKEENYARLKTISADHDIPSDALWGYHLDSGEITITDND